MRPPIESLPPRAERPAVTKPASHPRRETIEALQVAQAAIIDAGQLVRDSVAEIWIKAARADVDRALRRLEDGASA